MTGPPPGIETEHDHRLGDPECWCGPGVWRLCPCARVAEPEPVLDDDEVDDLADVARAAFEGDDDCWRCGGELLMEVSEWELRHGDSDLLIQHRGPAWREQYDEDGAGT